MIGHRGARAIEPENTIRSFVRAEAEGADEIELDLRVTADGRLVILHDAAVDRTTDGTGELAGLSFAELRELDAGEGERVPTFAEVLDAVTLPIQAEVKEMAAVAPLAGLARSRPLAGRILVSSFGPEIVTALAEVVPELPRALIMSGAPDDAVTRGRAVGASMLCLGVAALEPSLREECRAAGMSVDAWPVNDPAALRRAVDLEVEAITTDNPHLISGWL
ncbi:MAG TPA: glycerophosphodiester phosphodiesterase family protein [Mycobacteriales bacterium]|nr:glycerophosphodiester phosphodiesterase family protein [Mycobacteriales bacterium]